MKFTIEAYKLLKKLQYITPILQKNDISTIFQNILIKINQKCLTLTASNLETEIVAKIYVKNFYSAGEITVSGKKLLNICKGLPSQSIVKIEQIENNILQITTLFSYFKLLTLPAMNYPKLYFSTYQVQFNISEKIFKNVIKTTQFCMATNDIQYCLNGMLLEIYNKTLKSVTTDGHRMAILSVELNTNILSYTVIISRKNVIEMVRLLNDSSELIIISINKKNFKLKINDITFTTKLIEGNFPHYKKLVIKKFDTILKISSLQLKQSLTRISVLSDKKFKAVQFYIKKNFLKLTASNEEDEIAEENIQVDTDNEEDIKFVINATYIIDILNVIKDDFIYVLFNKPISTIQVQREIISKDCFIVMPLIF
ncbi:DNA polymerase III subunit beta [Buchnera aphidicola (Nipponaphis monzeni)]|uniref:Beta sliding clamp n=1 Tax=Buchnera aphidicola (Nipponaphis monzeni) TaxID=2495405 RepID=A0A455T9M9_9GAMM|nr:DNA polymerase III subunit beta [Buchnera aphidicola]BBI01029.1 DNA polymerase III subunit beta [Buchnera aphidicola (Nipponaphis monzeni)]